MPPKPPYINPTPPTHTLAHAHSHTHTRAKAKILSLRLPVALSSAAAMVSSGVLTSELVGFAIEPMVSTGALHSTACLRHVTSHYVTLRHATSWYSD